MRDEIARALERGRRIALLRLRLFQRGARDLDIGTRTLDLGLDVALIQASDDLTRLDSRAFRDAQLFQAS